MAEFWQPLASPQTSLNYEKRKDYHTRYCGETEHHSFYRFTRTQRSSAHQRGHQKGGIESCAKTELPTQSHCRCAPQRKKQHYRHYCTYSRPEFLFIGRTRH